MLSFIALSALLSAPASAGSPDGQDHELSLEVGSLGTPDRNWEYLSPTDGVGTLGIRGGYALSPAVTLVGSYHWRRYVTDFEVESDDDPQEFEAMFATNQVQAGAKVDVQVQHWLRPYGTLQVMGVGGRLRLDGDLEDDEKGTNYRSFSPGAAAALGLDLVPGSPRSPAHFATHLEMGYGYVLPLGFEDADAGNQPISLGDLEIRGFYVRWGAGVHF